MGRGRKIAKRFAGIEAAQPEGKKRFSQILDAIGADERRERVSVSDLMRAMDARAVAALILLFALPNVVPTPPGTSSILGLPLLYLTAQMMLGKLPWLPAIIADRSMTRSDFNSFVGRVTPLLARAERLLKPRLLFVTSATGERIIGGICLTLAIVLALPIPLGNMLPAFAISLMALGVLERDGLWVIIGVLVGVFSLVIVSGVVWALAKALIFVIVNAF
ncbi:exopolysaccharide biosynthesis protein [Rhodobacter sp. HX-7-19]|uniref:Exopolysaccharide biosynthesis protein n=1 Tax=Paragemmobacter kunshanensis TaxID=2583234 RepID=A0A6M1U020_9RHOB|nr:exopolysaccharide biosynthesis protein [Rhodobacter kunshanensis]NGQ92246.1 exopolysaccharide biosynthesis protein [Rhodobacter kunshanensis]